MTLANQGNASADIEIAGDKAYIGFDSPNAPQVEIVQIGDPRFPISAGVVPGVGGRLQVVDGILYGASYGYATEGVVGGIRTAALTTSVSYTHLRAHETVLDLVCRLLLEKKKKTYINTRDGYARAQ